MTCPKRKPHQNLHALGDYGCGFEFCFECHSSPDCGVTCRKPELAKQLVEKMRKERAERQQITFDRAKEWSEMKQEKQEQLAAKNEGESKHEAMVMAGNKRSSFVGFETTSQWQQKLSALDLRERQLQQMQSALDLRERQLQQKKSALELGQDASTDASTDAGESTLADTGASPNGSPLPERITTVVAEVADDVLLFGRNEKENNAHVAAELKKQEAEEEQEETKEEEEEEEEEKEVETKQPEQKQQEQKQQKQQEQKQTTQKASKQEERGEEGKEKKEKTERETKTGDAEAETPTIPTIPKVKSKMDLLIGSHVALPALPDSDEEDNGYDSL